MRLMVNKLLPTGHGILPRLAGRLLHTDPELLNRLHGTGDHDLEAQSRLFSLAIAGLRFGAAYKRTAPGRLPVAERHLVEAWQESGQSDSSSPIQVLDMGASDATTSLDLLNCLSTNLEAPIRLVAADRDNVLEVWRWGPLVEYRSGAGSPVLARLGPLGVRLPRSGIRFDWLGDWTARLYMACGGVRRRLNKKDTIVLVNPRVTRSGAITIKTMDATRHETSFDQTFDIVRCCNMMNREYFDDAMLTTIASHLDAYLKPGGLLQISRNVGTPDDETEHGTVWVKTLEGLQEVSQHGDGSEVRDVIEALQPARYVRA